MISTDDLLSFLDEALDDLLAILDELGDERANQRLDLPGANSPYAVVTHCLGVLEYWGGEVIADRTISRDRPAEFVATGPVAELVARARRARAQLAEDLAGLDPAAPPRGPVKPRDAVLPVGRTQGGVIIHLYQELVQHLGQVEVTRDVLLTQWVRRA